MFAVWQSTHCMSTPSEAMWTSTSRDGSNMDFSRSPCLTLFPPPPKKWHVPQFARCGRPTCCATFARSTDGSGIPAAPAAFTYVDVLSWQARQSTFSGFLKSKDASAQP